MLRYSFLIIIISFTNYLSAQNFQWAKNIGQNQNDNSGSCILTDPQGNVYVLGTFYDDVDFDPGPEVYNLSSDNGSSSIFILKLDSTGQFIWARSIGGSFGANGYAMQLDLVGNIYLAGSFDDMVDFDPGVGTYFLNEVPDQNNSGDSFIMKLDSSGDFLWAKSFGGTQIDGVNSLVTDDQNNVYAVGIFMQPMDIDPGPGVHEVTPNGTIDSFVMKLDTDGNQMWAETFGSAFITEARDIALDAEANLYITGNYSETVDFNTGADVFELTSVGSSSAYVLKIDSSGTFGWVKDFGGSNASSYGSSISLDDVENIYVTGSFNGTVDFDPGETVQNLVSSVNHVFVCKLNASGDLLWTTSTQDEGFSNAGSLALDGDGHLYVIGAFMDTVDFDGGAEVTNYLSHGSFDIFMMKMATVDGSFLWASSAGNYEMDSGSDVCVDPWGNIYSTGYFFQSVDFDPGVGIYNLSASNYGDCFISRLGACSPLYPVGPVLGPLAACEGSTSAVYTCGWATGASEIEWTVPDGCSILSGQNTTSIQVAFGSNAGTITVVAENTCYGPTSDAIEVVSTPVPYFTQQPSEQTLVAGDTVHFTVDVSADGATFQWYSYYSMWSINELNNNAFTSGATSDSLSFGSVTTGNNNLHFFCIATLNGCSDTSEVALLNVLPNNVENINAADFIILFPNPADDAITIQSNQNLLGMPFTLNDNLGRQVFTGKINSIHTVVDMSELAGGIYFLHVGLDKKDVLKVVKK